MENKAYLVEVITPDINTRCFLHPTGDGEGYVVAVGTMGAALWKGQDSVNAFIKHAGLSALVAVDLEDVLKGGSDV